MNRDFLKMLLMFSAMALGTLCLFGCQAPKFDAPWVHADSHAEDIGQKVTDAATKVSGSATEIVTAAPTAGLAAASPSVNVAPRSIP